MNGALRSAISGIPYPASKSEIISYARSKATGNGVLDVLNEIPAQEYGSEEELLQAVTDEGKKETGESDPEAEQKS